MKVIVEKEEPKKSEEKGKDPSGWKNSGEIDTYKLMVLLNNLIRSGKLNLIALNEDVFKNVAYDFDINERDGSISKDDELYKTAKKYLPFSKSGKFSVKSPLWIDPNNKHGDHIHIRLRGYSGRIHLDISPEHWDKFSAEKGGIQKMRDDYVSKKEAENKKLEKEGKKPKKIKGIGKRDPIKLVQYKGDDSNIIVLDRGGDNKFSWGLPDMIKVIENLPSDGPWDIGNLSQQGPNGVGASSPYSISHETGANVDIAIPLVGGGSTKQGNWDKFPVASHEAFKQAKVSEASKEWTGEIEPSDADADEDRIELKTQIRKPMLLVPGAEKANPISRIKLYDWGDPPAKHLINFELLSNKIKELPESLTDEEFLKAMEKPTYDATKSLRDMSEVFSTDAYFRNAIRDIWIRENDSSTINYNGIPYTNSERIDVSQDLQNFRRDRFKPELYFKDKPKHKSYLLQNLIAIDFQKGGDSREYYNSELKDDYKKGSKINFPHLDESNDYTRGNKMKITKERLAQIIKEEVEAYKASQLNEVDVDELEEAEEYIKEIADLLKSTYETFFKGAAPAIGTPQTKADTGEPVTDQTAHEDAKGLLLDLLGDAIDEFQQKEPELNEDGHDDVPSAVRAMKTMAEDALEMLDALEQMDGSLPTWWTNKMAVSASMLNKMRDYLLVPSMEEEMDEQ